MLTFVDTRGVSHPFDMPLREIIRDRKDNRVLLGADAGPRWEKSRTPTTQFSKRKPGTIMSITVAFCSRRALRTDDT